MSAAAPEEAAVVSGVVLGRPAAALAVAGRAVGAVAVADAAVGAAVGAAVDAAAAGLSYLPCSRRNCLSSGGKRGNFPS